MLKAKTIHLAFSLGKSNTEHQQLNYAMTVKQYLSKSLFLELCNGFPVFYF